MTEGIPARPPKRRERTQWTLKGPGFDGELPALVAKAARMSGMSISAWVAHQLRQQATAVIKGERAPDAGPPAVPPARIDDLEQRLAALDAAVRTLTEHNERTLWDALMRRVRRSKS